MSTGQNIQPTGSMYLVLPVPFRIHENKLQVEAQAANGLDRWADNFESVTVAAPVLTDPARTDIPGFLWQDFDSLQHRERVVPQPLPAAYGPASFLKALTPVRSQIAASIRASDHLQFAIGGLLGDWAAVAALESIRQRRRYAIHTDRVEHEVMRKTSAGASLQRRLRNAVEIPLMERYHHHVIQHCSLGLWHGDDCYRAYSPWCRENHLIHDIHTKSDDLIDSVELARKLDDLRQAPELNLCYTGRIDPMKAPLEWLRAIATARDLGAKVKATWYGEGTMLAEARAECSRLELDSIVTYAGFVSGRAALLAHVRAAHALVFTHITPESPRNLLESLVSGTPILGYDNAYARDLLAQQGGGALVPVHDTQALGALVAALAADRERLVTLTQQAAANGRRFTDAGVFAERSDLVRTYA